MHSFRHVSHTVVASRQGGTGNMLQVRVCPCLKVWVLLRSPRCLQLQHRGICPPALQAKDIPCISRSRFLQRSGCYAALFIPGVWHCLPAELVHLEEGACCTPGEGVQLHKWLSLLAVVETQGLEQKKSLFPCGRQPTAGFYSSRGEYKLNNVELDFHSEGHACL